MSARNNKNKTGYSMRSRKTTQLRRANLASQRCVFGGRLKQTTKALMARQQHTFLMEGV